LAFSRDNNFNPGVRILGGGTKVMLKVGNGSKITLSLSRVVFASSADVEDTEHFEFLKGKHPLLERRHAFAALDQRLSALTQVRERRRRK
jgi:hypothetical protein